MRVSKEKAAENREQIQGSGAPRSSARHLPASGVDALTEAAGMTHGSLYSQFGSKDRLVEDAVAYAIAGQKGREIPDAFAVSDYVFRIASVAGHRDVPRKRMPAGSSVL